MGKTYISLSPAKFIELNKPIVHVVPHSHYDAIWIFSKEENFDINCNYIIKKAIEILKTEKDFKFIIEQTYLLENIEINYPELFSEIKQFIQEGRIEIAGGEYLMSDVMLPSGEVLIREILEGKNYVKEKFGKDVIVAWGADEFGYNAQWPQILKESGYKYFAFRRGVAEPLISEFYWKGLDGTEILSHWMPLGYRAGLDLNLLPETFEQLRRLSTTRHVLMPSGSGSTPPQPELCNTLLNYNESTKNSIESPLMKVSTPTEFFRDLEQEIKEKNIRISTKTGEMYSGKASFVFPDSTSTRSWIKQGFKEYENNLLMLERWNTILNLVSSNNDFGDDLKKYWKQALFFAMHDSLPGTGIDSVYDEMRSAFDKMDNTIKKTLNECLTKVIKATFNQNDKEHCLIVFNSVSWEIKEWVEATIRFDIDEAFEIMELRSLSSNEIIDVEILDIQLHEKDRGIKSVQIGFIARLPALGYAIYQVIYRKKEKGKNGGMERIPLLAYPRSYETKFNFDDYTLEIDAETGIFSLMKSDRLYFIGNEVRIEEELGDLYYHKDVTGIIKSESGEGIPFGVFKKEKYSVENGKIRTKIVFQNKYYAIRWPYRLNEKLPTVLYQHSFLTIRKEVLIYKGLSRIDCRTFIENNHPHVRIRVKFDVPFKGYTYWTGTQFGAIQRPTNLYYLNKDPEVTKKWKEVPSGTFPSIEWLDYSNKQQDIGVTFTHFGIPSHEVRDNSIYFTLLRGVETLSADGTKGPCIATPDAAEKRPYMFKYSLVPHQGNWCDGSSYREGIAFNMKPIAIHLANWEKEDKRSSDNLEKENKYPIGNGISFMSVSPKNVIVSTLKLPQIKEDEKSGKTIILRIYETEGKTVNARISFYFPIISATFVDLLEKAHVEAKKEITVFGEKNNSLNLALKPFKIYTIRVKLDIDL
ncbi:glycosyl hydrolase-related protein [Candidatus Nitrosocosmicus agrestis]|uniref:glycoside hydrolase family 38 N-terminal domain-containing protein n=1 Tax=Candidatus Nitrosocosmicus agrestis TaxID=2563600 RepID=UPI00122E67BF|nr:glycosyl hydrolase-related protein [Candidatus Nitrosocosmicus sp. SS]KAA2283355.1 glycoside hydrolase [Candidatus Nitrosocosmicus sp. SS]KAF0868999.1 glycoside hydrolase [Candidatus Nitrosocosmicus sp. SS]